MDKVFRTLAILGNASALLFALYITTEMNVRRGEELLVLLAMFGLPTVNLLALCVGADRETRQLRRAVEKARLKKALADLQAGHASPESATEKGSCCGH